MCVDRNTDTEPPSKPDKVVIDHTVARSVHAFYGAHAPKVKCDGRAWSDWPAWARDLWLVDRVARHALQTLLPYAWMRWLVLHDRVRVPGMTAHRARVIHALFLVFDPVVFGGFFAYQVMRHRATGTDQCCLCSAGADAIGMTAEAVTVTTSNVIFAAAPNARVALDGTRRITSTWTQHTGSIWKTTLDFDVWQLFLGYEEEFVPARWPNAFFHDGSVFDSERKWAHGTITKAQEYTNGNLIDKPHDGIDLAASGIDATGAIAVLNVGSFKTKTRRVNAHTPGTNSFTYDSVGNIWKTKHHHYFFEGKLAFLDAEREWFFDPATKELYLWPKDGADPNGLEIRGKVRSYAFSVNEADGVTLRNIEFFGAAFHFNKCTGCIVDGAHLTYPSNYKRMLGVVNTQPEMAKFEGNSKNCTVRNSSFRYTDGSALEMYANNMLIENSYFFHIDWTATDSNGLMTTIQLGGDGNVIRRNTMHKTGASATLNPGDAAIIELNDIYDTGYVQSDGAISQMMVNQQPQAEVRYNWFHDTVKYGARFDGNGDGNNGAMHHNVIWNVSHYQHDSTPSLTP